MCIRDSDKGQRFNRGNIIHRLLQTLPDIADGSKREAARRYLALDSHKLSNNAQTKILEETLAVINDPKFHTIFGLASRAEVPLVGQVNGKIISAQIDRLVVQKDLPSITSGSVCQVCVLLSVRCVRLVSLSLRDKNRHLEWP